MKGAYRFAIAPGAAARLRATIAEEPFMSLTAEDKQWITEVTGTMARIGQVAEGIAQSEERTKARIGQVVKGSRNPRSGPWRASGR